MASKIEKAKKTKWYASTTGTGVVIRGDEKARIHIQVNRGSDMNAKAAKAFRKEIALKIAQLLNDECKCGYELDDLVPAERSW